MIPVSMDRVDFLMETFGLSPETAIESRVTPVLMIDGVYREHSESGLLKAHQLYMGWMRGYIIIVGAS